MAREFFEQQLPLGTSVLLGAGFGMCAVNAAYGGPSPLLTFAMLGFFTAKAAYAGMLNIKAFSVGLVTGTSVALNLNFGDSNAAAQSNQQPTFKGGRLGRAF